MFGDVTDRKGAFLEIKICILYVRKVGNVQRG